MPSSKKVIRGTDLAWERVYMVAPTNKKRALSHQKVDVEDGIYILRQRRNQKYRLSWQPRLERDGWTKMGEEIDLGEHRLRRDCDERVRKHLDTGK